MTACALCVPGFACAHSRKGGLSHVLNVLETELDRSCHTIRLLRAWLAYNPDTIEAVLQEDL